MPLYNMTTIARAQLTTNDLHSVLRNLSGVIVEKKGVVANIKNWGLQNLAYRMKSRQDFHTQGRIFQMKFVLSPAALGDLEYAMKMDERLLRWMVMKEKNTSLVSLGAVELSQLSKAAEGLANELQSADKNNDEAFLNEIMNRVYKN
mmetsp:Transcript_15573/g.35631  ORF Transcript_15573/g.35631 Transcript_15573/m.35631 type:complete len:147 (-) Transcript_15573:43-483(-)